MAKKKEHNEPATEEQQQQQDQQNAEATEAAAENAEETTSEDVGESIVAKAAEANAKWFVIHSQTGHEDRVRNALEQRVKSLGVDDRIFQIVVPTREVVVVKKGKKTKQKERVFPGYILVKMLLDDQTWLVVRTTEGVTGFIGTGQKPTPISEKEVDAIMKFVSQEQPKYKAKFSVGEAVKITDGPFADFLGTIDDIDEEKGKIRVLVSIFDRETPVELDFLQVNKM
jgi:transcriptional antiterminator NusG